MPNKEDPTVVQRVLSSSALALESTMHRLRRLKNDEPEPGSSGIALQDDDAELQGRSGRVVHDARGSAIWNWALEAGVSALESTHRLLKRLETPSLSLEDPNAKPSERPEPGGGYDPYNRGKPTKRP